jgi:hypothetical protein
LIAFRPAPILREAKRPRGVYLYGYHPQPPSKETSMRIALIGFAALTIVLPASIEMAAAQSSPRPWCLQSGRGGPGGGLPDCTYYTLQQCRASMGGGAEGCFQNPALAWDRIEGKRYAQPPRSRTPASGY